MLLILFSFLSDFSFGLCHVSYRTAYSNPRNLTSSFLLIDFLPTVPEIDLLLTLSEKEVSCLSVLSFRSSSNQMGKLIKRYYTRKFIHPNTLASQLI